MHFWIDKRSSQLHQYGGGRRGASGAGGFYSQNFGTHRNNHHPHSLGHHHPHRVHRDRTRSSTTNSAPSANSSSSATNNNNFHPLSITPNNNNHSTSSNTGVNGNSGPAGAPIALQYPHQQPHQVQGQHTLIGTASYGNQAVHGPNSTSIMGSNLRSSRGDPVRNATTSFFNHPPQQQPILGGGILAISGSSSSAVNVAAAMNPPMAIVAGDDGDGVPPTTVLTFPPSAAAMAVNPSNSINVQLISCVNINPDSSNSLISNRGGIDLSWRNPYRFDASNMPGSSVSRCRAYSRDTPSSLVSGDTSGASSRGTRGRRTSSSSSSGLGRSSIGTVPGTIPSLSNNSQHPAIDTPEGMTDRSMRSEHTSFDRETITPQRSISLTSPEAAEQSSAGTSSGGRPSLEQDPGWACTKRVGLTLCFLAFILLGTVGAKFMIQGPGVIDTSRTGKAEAAAYFLFTELIFVAFAMALFFIGVSCLRKRTNDYLLRQFNQYILSSSSVPAGSGRGTHGNLAPGQEPYDYEYYEGTHHPPGSNGSPSRGHHHHLHHTVHHGGFHHYRHHRSNGSLLEEGEFGSAADLAQSQHSFNGAGPIHYPAHYGNGSNNSRRSKPPPYHIALYLPLPEGMGGSSPIEDNNANTSNPLSDGKSSKLIGASDGIGFIDSSSIKDAQDAAGGNNVHYIGSLESSTNENRDSSSRNTGAGAGDTNDESRRSETPPPPYEQL